MTHSLSSVRIFIGSSSEGKSVARYLQTELSNELHIERWDQGIFKPGESTLTGLLTTAGAADFAILIATPDDTTLSRGETTLSARDNIIFEYGLFAGKIGPERTYLLPVGDIKIPSDVLGITRLPYNPNTPNPRGAVTEAAVQIEERATQLGPLSKHTRAKQTAVSSALDKEIDLICSNAVAQGWTVKTNSVTTLRLQPPHKRSHALNKKQAEITREELRNFVAELRANGLRVNDSVRRPPSESPFT